MNNKVTVSGEFSDALSYPMNCVYADIPNWSFAHPKPGQQQKTAIGLMCACGRRIREEGYTGHKCQDCNDTLCEWCCDNRKATAPAPAPATNESATGVGSVLTRWEQQQYDIHKANRTSPVLRATIDRLAAQVLDAKGAIRQWCEHDVRQRAAIDTLKQQLEYLEAGHARIGDALGIPGGDSDARRWKHMTVMISDLRQQLADITKANKDRNGEWIDEWGACKVCDGEIPQGHQDCCDIFKQERKVRELEQQLAQRDKEHKLAEKQWETQWKTEGEANAEVQLETGEDI